MPSDRSTPEGRRDAIWGGRLLGEENSLSAASIQFEKSWWLISVEESPLVSVARLDATSLAYSELRSVSNFGRWKEGGEKVTVEMSR